MTTFAPLQSRRPRFNAWPGFVGSVSTSCAAVRRALHMFSAEVLPQFAQGGASVAAVTAVSLAMRATCTRRAAQVHGPSL